MDVTRALSISNLSPPAKTIVAIPLSRAISVLFRSSPLAVGQLLLCGPDE